MTSEIIKIILVPVEAYQNYDCLDSHFRKMRSGLLAREREIKWVNILGRLIIQGMALYAELL